MDAPRRTFLEALRPVLDRVADSPLDETLADDLNRRFPVGGPVWNALAESCEEGIREGWMGLEGDEKRLGGRVVEPGLETRGLSVDLVQITDLAGPHHRHPRGEVCAVLPVSAGATFDGHGAGWAVYPPGSDHVPTGENGCVRVLFFLPGGEIEYTDGASYLGSGSG